MFHTSDEIVPKNCILQNLINPGLLQSSQNWDYNETFKIFNAKYSNKNAISKSTVSKIQQKFIEVEHVTFKPRSGRPVVDEDNQL